MPATFRTLSLDDLIDKVDPEHRHDPRHENLHYRMSNGRVIFAQRVLRTRFSIAVLDDSGEPNPSNPVNPMTPITPVNPGTPMVGCMDWDDNGPNWNDSGMGWCDEGA